MSHRFLSGEQSATRRSPVATSPPRRRPACANSRIGRASSAHGRAAGRLSCLGGSVAQEQLAARALAMYRNWLALARECERLRYRKFAVCDDSL